ncbi:MAG: S8/S53 family peptidase [Candidatus Poribacteria bacterium]|nr:S8/S53 family peptidase [Candidatus Poribacteria bacterium]
MHSFIALRKKSNVQAMSSDSTLTTEDKPEQQNNDKLFSKFANALTQKITDTLARLGFKEIIPEVPLEGTQESVSVQESKDENESNFMPLNNLGAFVVNSPNKKKIEEVKDSFEESDYDIVSNVQLSLLKPTYSNKVLRRRIQIPWTKESGIYHAHSQGVLGKGVLVGVLDTGCDTDHIQFRRKQIDFRYVPLQYKSKQPRDVRGFDVDGHGTHVCGIIAGEHIGIAPAAELMVASVIESETYQTSLSRISIALDWMLSQSGSIKNRSKPFILNMSFGFVPEHIPKNDRDALMTGFRDLISTLVENFDVLPIVAIGNDGPGNMRAPGYFAETLSVGAVGFDHKPAPFSGGGLSPIERQIQPNIVGYGIDIFSSLEREKNNRSLYKYMSGTSMATPYVAGIAALYASADTKLKGEKLRQHLLNTALPLQASADRGGAGLARYTEDGNEKS